MEARQSEGRVTEREIQLFLLIFLKAAHTHTRFEYIYVFKKFIYQFLISIQPRQPSRVKRALENSFRCWKKINGK